MLSALTCDLRPDEIDVADVGEDAGELGKGPVLAVRIRLGLDLRGLLLDLLPLVAEIGADARLHGEETFDLCRGQLAVRRRLVVRLVLDLVAQARDLARLVHVVAGVVDHRLHGAIGVERGHAETDHRDDDDDQAAGKNLLHCVRPALSVAGTSSMNCSTSRMDCIEREAPCLRASVATYVACRTRPGRKPILLPASG